MTRYLARTLAAASLVTLLGAHQVAGATAMANGGFEGPDVASWTLKNAGDTGITGWTVVGNTISFQDNAAFGNLGVVASEGRQFLDLTGVVGRGGGVRADAVTTTVGMAYQLSFDLGAFFVAGQGSFGNVTVDLWINGVTQGSFTNLLALTVPGSDWETQSLDFVATGASTVVEIRSSLSASSSNLGVGLDNVRLMELSGPPPAVPEPGSAALVGLGLAAMGLRSLRVRRRR